jgi:ubiquinone/menaquinone biosynthesis C-methylase UbiE
MEGMEYFYELFEALPRCGPGDNKSTQRAFNTIPKMPPRPYILDIGCGPGMQTIELAKLSGGTIIALDNHRPFLDTLMKKALDEDLLDNIIPKNMSMLDMDFKENTFDIIWSEGALYFMGFQNGLRRCHYLLQRSGFLAVTELVCLVNNPPVEVMHYFEKEYPAIKTIGGNLELIQSEKFRMISHFTLPKSAWLESFYLPMGEELIRLKKKYKGNEIASGVFDEISYEISFFEKFSDFFGYEFFIMEKSS